MVYSGSIERVDFGERKEEKGFCVVTIHEKQYATYEFIKTPTRPFIQIEVHLTQDNDHTQSIIAEIERHKLEDAVIKIVYHLPTGVKDRVDTTLFKRHAPQHGTWLAYFLVRTLEVRERRASLKVDMALEQLLSSYIDTKSEYKEQKKSLIEKALQLEAELFEQDHQ